MNFFITLAKEAVEKYIDEEKIISPSENLPAEFFKKKAGVFVTIEKNGQVRGCIGTYLATKENIAREIISNAVAAAEDYRFGLIQKEELPHLAYAVYVLSKPELVKDISKLDPKKFGIIVKSQGFVSGSDVIFNTAPKFYQKTGLLLPGLKGINATEEQISIACQKGEINPAKEKIFIYRFTVEKHHEK